MRYWLDTVKQWLVTLNFKGAKLQIFAAIFCGWLLLNGLIYFAFSVGSTTDFSSTMLISFVVLNLWFGVFTYVCYAKVMVWLKQRFTAIDNTERWASEYLSYSPDMNVSSYFNQGEWVVGDAIIALDNALQRSLDDTFQTDKLVRSQAFLDAQTGIGNRLYFDHRVEAYISEREHNGGGCVFLIQLKELDVIQSELGEAEIIELLGYFIGLINKYLEDYPDSVFARRSEFDFAILLPRIIVSEAEKVASRLVRLCNRIPLPDVVDHDHFFHIGVASFQQSESAYQVLAEADMALRAAQLQGPSNWFMYDKGVIVKDLAKGSVQWRTAIDLAINQQAFVLLFQPVTMTDGGNIHHHEILARMRNSNGHLVSASIFLPMAQKFGMVARVDQLMVEKTIKLLNYEKSAQDICSLNLHIDSLLDRQFQHWLLGFLQSNPTAAARIIFEISEYSLVTYGSKLASLFRALHKVGTRLLVDHVGLYVLNTQYIRQFEIDYLKLHVSVVKNIDSRPENQLFIKSLLNACNGTHVLVFGLGVERVGEWIALQKIGVAGAQGHYFTEPLESIHQISPSH